MKPSGPKVALFTALFWLLFGFLSWCFATVSGLTEQRDLAYLSGFLAGAVAWIAYSACLVDVVGQINRKEPED